MPERGNTPAYAQQSMSQSPYSHSDRELLSRIGRSSGSKAGYKQLVRELGLGGGRERRLLVEQLTRIVARGELRQLEPGLWAMPKATGEASVSGELRQLDANGKRGAGTGRWQGSEAATRNGRERLQSGRLELHRDGYGFVRPEAGRGSGASGVRSNSSAGQGATAAADIFIPPTALHGAMHGDLVLVEEDAAARDGRRSGRIARVLTRRNPTLVGIFYYSRPHGRRTSSRYAEEGRAPRGNFVQPLDERLGGPVEVAEGDEQVSRGTESQHRTLGTEAYQAQRRGKRAGSEAAAIAIFGSGEPFAAPDSDALMTEAQAADKDSTGLEERWPLEGLAVEVEILSFAQPGRPARGRVVEVLGPPDGFGVDVEIVIRKHAIPHTFPAHVLAEAEERSGESVGTLDEEELALRQDFRGQPVVTIDGETARDFDDAVLVRTLASGNTELQVHIADVGWYVREGSALDTEARVRGTSVYFPDRAVPMLPHALSSGMCSLLPHEDRFVLSCVMEIDGQGEIVGYRVCEGLIRSARRMTYTSVQQCLNASPDAENWNAVGERSPEKQGVDNKEGQETPIKARSVRTITPEPTAEDRAERERVGLEQPELPMAFDRMLELALRLNQKRVRRGSIDFDLPEPVVEFDPDGNMKAIVRSERGWAHRLIEEFMLSANECVATWLTGQAIPSIYRIHEMPDPKRVVEFEETAAGFGQTLGIGALPVKRMTMKSDRRDLQRRSAEGRRGGAAPVHELPARIPVTPQMYQGLVRRIQGTPEERILAYLMLRSLKQARYAEKNEGHFALASPCYTHFTSPIRRYPDLIVHRLLRTMLRSGADGHGGAIRSGDPQPWAAELARSQGKHAGAAPRAAKAVAPMPIAAFQRPESSPPTAVESATRPFKRARRPGRIGWSQESESGSVQARSHVDASDLEAEFLRRDEDTDQVEMAKRVAEPAESSQSERRFATPPPRHAEPISAEELADIAVESSQAERRAADAERELIEWKKMKFMAGRIGEDFRGIILSITKYGFFVELDELFIEGLVPLSSLTGDFYSFRDTDRTICGARTEHCFQIGDRVEVVLDRIDRQQRRLQFALLPGTEPAGKAGGSIRAGKSEAKKAKAEARRQEKLAAKPKAAKMAKKPKSKARRKG